MLNRLEDSEFLLAVILRVVGKRQTAKYLGESLMTLTRMEQQGLMPPLTEISPRRVGYRVIDLIKWLNAQRRGAEPARPTTLHEDLEALRALCDDARDELEMTQQEAAR